MGARSDSTISAAPCPSRLDVASALAGTEAQLGTGASGCAIATGGCSVTQAACVDLMSGTVSLTKYLKSMPVDPTGGTTYAAANTGYSVVVDANGIVTVKACGTEGTTNISQSR